MRRAQVDREAEKRRGVDDKNRLAVTCTPSDETNKSTRQDGAKTWLTLKPGAGKPEKRRRKFSFSWFSPATAVRGRIFDGWTIWLNFAVPSFSMKKWRNLLNLPNNFFNKFEICLKASEILKSFKFGNEPFRWICHLDALWQRRIRLLERLSTDRPQGVAKHDGIFSLSM